MEPFRLALAAGALTTALSLGCSGESRAPEAPTLGPRFTYARGQKNPCAIFVAGDTVVWLNLGTFTQELGSSVPTGDGSVLRCNSSGCDDSPTPIAESRTILPADTAFAGDGESAYFIDSASSLLIPGAVGPSRVVKCSMDGCDASMEVVSERRPSVMVAYGAYLYATEFSATVYALPTSAGADATPTELWSAGSTPSATGIAVDDSGVYWGTTAAPALMQCGLTGCNNSPRAVLPFADVGQLFPVAVDERNVYFADSSPDQLGGIFACPKAGCESPTVLASGIEAPTAIATDGKSVYWTEAGVGGVLGLIRKCAVGGCGNAPTTVAIDLWRPVALALDEHFVYVVDRGSTDGDGGVGRFPK